MCEMPSVYGCDHPKARKEHKCCECRGVIPVGEVYNKHRGIWDGSADTFKVCVDCDLLRNEVDNDERDPECKTAFGYLSESVFEVGDRVFVKRFLEIKRKRGAEIRDWMIERELKNRQ
jgi:hypothetical protein